MKIAFIADFFLLDKTTGVNGTQVQMYNLASAFEDRGFEVHYISLTQDSKPADEVIDGIRIHWIPRSKNLFSWIKDIRTYKKILNRIQPDVLYQRGRSHLTYTAAEWAKKNKAKFIWGSNGEDSCDFWKLIKRVQRSKRPLWKKLLLYPYVCVQDVLIHKGIRGASQVVNQTEHQKARLQKNYAKEGIVLPSYFLPPSEDQKRVKENIVLWLANVNPGKQPELFIRLAEYCQDCPGWKFILGGGTHNRKYWQDISSLASRLPNLKLIGSVPFNETHEYFARASLFVNTSLKEADGLPNAFIQAWLNQTPILSLNHDPNDWMKTNHLGFCAHGNLEDFLNKGKALITEPQQIESMSQNCDVFARKTFASDETINAYVRILNDV